MRSERRICSHCLRGRSLIWHRWASVVESVWSGARCRPVDAVLGRHLAAVVLARRQAIEDDWQPVPRHPRCPWLEIDQGPYRAVTAERVALAESLAHVLAASATFDIAAGAQVAMDQVAGASARGDWAACEVALRHAVCLTAEVPSTSPWFGYGRVWCAVYAWRCGDAERELEALGRIPTRASADAIEAIRAKADARRVADGLDERWWFESSLDAGSRAAWAHHDAGHVPALADTHRVELCAKRPEVDHLPSGAGSDPMQLCPTGKTDAP